MKLSANKIGLALGGLFGFLHFVWSVLVAVDAGVAQRLIDTALGLHFLNDPFQVGAFSVSKAVALIIITTVIGYILGWLFAFAWNKVHER